jgi:hypothetical protein
MRQYVAFIRWLALKKSKVGNDVDSDADDNDDEGLGEPAPKRRKTVKTAPISKSVFDLAPSKMNDYAPISNKKTVPFKSMVSEKWLKKKPDSVLLNGGEWLSGFYSRLKEDELLENDAKYLKELDEWHKKEDPGCRNLEDGQPAAGPSM